MKHDKGLLKADKLAAFREWLVAAGFEVRDGKGEFQCLQVKTSPTCWAVVGRNAVGTLSTHPDLRALINRFNSDGTAETKAQYRTGEGAFKNFHRSLCDRFGYIHDSAEWWRDTVSLEEHIAGLIAKPAPDPTDTFLEDLRDDFAMRALAALINHPGKDHHNLGAKAVPTLAKFAYEYADAMLEARKVKPAEAPHQAKKSDNWSPEWKANGYNHCLEQASKALRHLADHDRPIGGESSFNSAHLFQIAAELEVTRRELLAP